MTERVVAAGDSDDGRVERISDDQVEMCHGFWDCLNDWMTEYCVLVLIFVAVLVFGYFGIAWLLNQRRTTKHQRRDHKI